MVWSQGIQGTLNNVIVIEIIAEVLDGQICAEDRLKVTESPATKVYESGILG